MSVFITAKHETHSYNYIMANYFHVK